MQGVQFSVFTKPWKDVIPDLARRVAGMGFDGIELPVRPGYPVTPDNVHELPAAVQVLKDHGVSVFSIAGPTNEAAFEACAAAGVGMVRVMAGIGPEGYLATERALQGEYERLVPLLARYGVAIGVQNHYGRFISNASGLRSLVSQFDPAHVGIVWDAAHNALNGEEPELAIDIVWSHLRMVNLKNAFWRQANGPEAASAEWRSYWTDGRHGLASWPRVAAELRRRSYEGVVCLTAEYSDEPLVDSLAAQDLVYARWLFSRSPG